MNKTQDWAILAINSARYSSTRLPAGGGASLEHPGVSHTFLHHNLQLKFSTRSLPGHHSCTCQRIIITLVQLTRQLQKTGGELMGKQKAMHLWE